MSAQDLGPDNKAGAARPHSPETESRGAASDFANEKTANNKPEESRDGLHAPAVENHEAESEIAIEKAAEFKADEVTYPEGGARGWATASGASLAILFVALFPVFLHVHFLSFHARSILIGSDTRL